MHNQILKKKTVPLEIETKSRLVSKFINLTNIWRETKTAATIAATCSHCVLRLTRNGMIKII